MGAAGLAIGGAGAMVAAGAAALVRGAVQGASRTAEGLSPRRMLTDDDDRQTTPREAVPTTPAVEGQEQQQAEEVPMADAQGREADGQPRPVTTITSIADAGARVVPEHAQQPPPAAGDAPTITEVTDAGTRGGPGDGQQPSSTVGGTTNGSSGSPDGPVQRVTTEVDTLARREDAPTHELRITRRGLLSVGHCLACHSENRAHHGHLYWGDCLRRGRRPTRSVSAEAEPLPEDLRGHITTTRDGADQQQAVLREAVQRAQTTTMEDGTEPVTMRQLSGIQQIIEEIQNLMIHVVERIDAMEGASGNIREQANNLRDDQRRIDARLGDVEAQMYQWTQDGWDIPVGKDGAADQGPEYRPPSQNATSRSG